MIGFLSFQAVKDGLTSGNRIRQLDACASVVFSGYERPQASQIAGGELAKGIRRFRIYNP